MYFLILPRVIAVELEFNAPLPPPTTKRNIILSMKKPEDGDGHSERNLLPFYCGSCFELSSWWQRPMPPALLP